MRSQSPLNSPFGAHSTAQDVVAGLDLSGATALVTGGHSGLGLETTRALAAAGARVIVAARDPERARASLGELKAVELEPLDLSDLDSVRDFAVRCSARIAALDILIGSAGIMACAETRVGPGWEAQFATNHLGHYALVNLLLPRLATGARVIQVSSAGHQLSAMRWEDVDFSNGYDKWQAYGQSKTANALFAVELDRLARSAGIRAFSLHPGKIFTPLQRHLTREEMIAAGWLDPHGRPADPSFKTPAQGAATQVWAATSTLLAGLGGLYCEDCNPAPLVDAPTRDATGVMPHALDAEAAARLWELSARRTGVNAFA
ncbi:SDR family NAD(P)-dependent oxidoreductase [uncultured Pseudomonas sp.]|uniref:SDR family NAD(P)-dependent oxidoreductase n=1 Tax=uncultured Pseudomonas sp. TaxID=114707 RepID=UPI0025DBFD81|nr:SDR family NAD(P)-dependent oxidoreductase [uncultured Pseudomonas sp.]